MITNAHLLLRLSACQSCLLHVAPDNYELMKEKKYVSLGGEMTAAVSLRKR